MDKPFATLYGMILSSVSIRSFHLLFQMTLNHWSGIITPFFMC